MHERRITHGLKTCPRCGRHFECKAGDPVHCDCARVTLTPETRDRIRRRYTDCLCLDCLLALSAGIATAGDLRGGAQAADG